MRRTLASLMPTAAAMVRVLQWVALLGCWRVVMVTTRLVRRAPMAGLRPGRCASFCNPATPSARKRLRQRDTFFGVIAMLAAISLSGWPGGCTQHDAGTLRHPHRQGSAPGLGFQPRPFLRTQRN